MKRLFVAASVLGLTVSAPAQGLIALDNDSANPNATPTATSGGLFFIPDFTSGVAKIHGDFNAAFYGGTDSANLTLIASFSGAAAVGSSFFGDGTWTDPQGKTYVVPGLENARRGDSQPNQSNRARLRYVAQANCRHPRQVRRKVRQ